MSYYVDLVIDTGDTEKGLTSVHYCGNYTSNVWPMFRAAIPPHGIQTLDGLSCVEAQTVLHLALLYFDQHRTDLEAMEPSNGWGSYHGAREFLYGILVSCIKHSKCTVRVCA